MVYVIKMNIYMIVDQKSNNKMSHDTSYKIVLIGDSSVGKSTLLRRFSDDSFTETYLPTIGVDFRFKTVVIQGRQIKLQIWDTAGQERFRTISSAYYKGAQGVVIVFDILCPTSLQNVCDFWLPEIEKYADAQVQIHAVGNKADCPNVLTEADYAFLKEKCPVSLVSAKTGEGVNQVFQTLSAKCWKQFGCMEGQGKQKTRVIDDIRKKKQQFKVKSGVINNKNKKCC